MRLARIMAGSSSVSRESPWRACPASRPSPPSPVGAGRERRTVGAAPAPFGGHGSGRRPSAGPPSTRWHSAAAAVEQLQPGGGHHPLAVSVELLVVDLGQPRLVTEAADAIGLPGAHLLQSRRSAQSRLSLRMERMASARLASPSTYSCRNRPPRVTGVQRSSPSSSAAGSSSGSFRETNRSSIKLATKPRHCVSPACGWWGG